MYENVAEHNTYDQNYSLHMKSHISYKLKLLPLFKYHLNVKILKQN